MHIPKNVVFLEVFRKSSTGMGSPSFKEKIKSHKQKILSVMRQ